MNSFLLCETGDRWRLVASNSRHVTSAALVNGATTNSFEVHLCPRTTAIHFHASRLLRPKCMSMRLKWASSVACGTTAVGRPCLPRNGKAPTTIFIRPPTPLPPSKHNPLSIICYMWHDFKQILHESPAAAERSLIVDHASRVEGRDDATLPLIMQAVSAAAVLQRAFIRRKY